MSHWPQLLTLGFLALAFALHCAKAGEPRDSYDPMKAVIGIVIELIILWNGGYFAAIGWGAP